MAQLLSNLPVGAKVKFGSIYNQPIVWLVAAKNHAGYPSGAITLLTERIVKIMAVDAREPSNSNIDREYYGNNRHIHSNILQWLNSQAGAGQWYQAQHAADAPPSSANVWSNHNPYDQQAGFLNAFSADEREAILQTTLTVVKSSADGGGSEIFKSKVFLLSATEVGLANESGIAEGSRLAMFTTDNGSRLCYPTAAAVSNSTYTDFSLNTGQPWYWWLRTPYASHASFVRNVSTDGGPNAQYACIGIEGLRPALNLLSSLLISDTTDSDGCYTFVWNTPPTKPPHINVPASIYGGKTAAVSWGASTDVDNNLSGYILQRSVNGGAYTQIFKGNALTYTDTITYGWNTVRYRVCAYDAMDAASDWRVSNIRTVINNIVPVISGSDSNLGVKTADFVQTYTVTDPDDGATVTVVEKIDGVVHRTYPVVLGATNTFDITGVTWLRLLNGSHTLTITATDDRGDTATRTYTFTKNVTSFSIEPSVPFEASVMPTRISLSVSRSIPGGSIFEVLVCNNANDDSPTWEDATSAVVGNLVHVFTNTTKTAATWAVGIKVNVDRGTGSGACYVSGIGGNFE